jgi:peroxiredoxin
MNGIRFVFLLLLIAVGAGGCGQVPGGCQASWVAPGEKLLGSKAPDFTLSNLAGEKIELGNLVREKATLLVFWATWCPSCVEEIPTLNEWTEKYPDLQILGINVEEPADRIRDFAEKFQIRYPVLLDEDAAVTQQYGLVGIPATILVAKGGQIIYYGFTLPENIGQLIKS